ncbi:DUF4129 domain-containing protein [Natrinema sp. 1APR25-10V2]|nr:DUF4129 domain-containing protein [Natrinema sp. 1APR25-10V2]
MALASPVGLAASSATVAADGDAVQRIAAQQNATENRSEIPAHRNPDDYAENGDLAAVEGWLTERLTSQLGEGAIQLSEGEYDLASEYVGEEYRERLGQYVDVAGETEGEGLADEFERAGEKQARLSEAVQEYRQTKAQYETARENGNEDRARELARKLESLATEIESLGGEVREHYNEIESATGGNLSESDAAVENVTTDIRSEQAVVRAQEFVETELTLTADREGISFLEPLVATGELRTADGAPIANEEIRLTIGARTERVTTDATGAFTLEYRPREESLSTANLTIEYVPDPQSVYLGADANVSVSIEQVEPTVSLTETPSELSYGEGGAVTGELRVDGVAVDNVALPVTVDGQRVGTATARNGTFQTAVSLPASVDDGRRNLTVRLPFEDRALAAAATTTTVAVRQTKTTLSIDAVPAGDRSLTVDGTLETVAGDGVRGESVMLRVDGSTVATATTGANGTFEETVTLPDSVQGGEVTVTAAYEASRSNLKGATAHAVVAIGEAQPGPSNTVWLGAGFIALIAVSIGVWLARRSGGNEPTPTDSPETDNPAGEPAAAARLADGEAVASLLDQARDQLAAGRPNGAARTGYAAVRRALASHVDARSALTHWEFYRTYRSDTADDAALLRDVTEAYERAAFDRDGVSADEAAHVLERARHLCDLEEPAADGIADD